MEGNPGVGNLPSNIATVDDGAQFGNVYKKVQSDSIYLPIAGYTNAEGKILAGMIEALGLTELISVSETSLAAFMANNGKYTFEKNDMIAIPNGSGNYALYIYNGGSKTISSSYLPTGLTNITIAMVEGLQAALNGKVDHPIGTGSYIYRVQQGINQWRMISIDNNYLPYFNGADFVQSIIYNDGTKVGVGTTTPSEVLHVNGRMRSKAQVFDENTESLPNQITLNARRYYGADLTGTRRMFMYRDYEDQLALVQSFSQVQKDTLGTAWNNQYSNGSLNVYSITPTVLKNDHIVRYLVLQGLNLNVNPLSTSVKFIPVGNALGLVK